MRVTNTPVVLDPTGGTYLPGIEPFPAWAVSDDNLPARTSGDLVVTFVRAPDTRTVTTHLTLLGAVAAAATPTLSRCGLWEVSADGTTAALVASSVNDTALYTGAVASERAAAYSESYRMISGRVYGLGSLVVSGVAMPRLQGIYGKTLTTNGRARRNGLRIAGLLIGQADLPATITISALSGVTQIPYHAAV